MPVGPAPASDGTEVLYTQGLTRRLITVGLRIDAWLSDIKDFDSTRPRTLTFVKSLPAPDRAIPAQRPQ